MFRLAPPPIVASVILASFALSAPIHADINAELRPSDTSGVVGESIALGLYFVSDSDATQYAAAADIILQWDENHLALASLDSTGAYPVLASSFPASHASGLNTLITDGDAMYVVFAEFGNPIPATPEGTLITTFLFDALAATPETHINLLPATLAPGESVIFDGFIPNFNVLGALAGSTIELTDHITCRWDTAPAPHGDGVVGLGDLNALLSNWGPCPDPCLWDFAPPAGDNIVGLGDLNDILSNWGPCP